MDDTVSFDINVNGEKWKYDTQADEWRVHWQGVIPPYTPNRCPGCGRCLDCGGGTSYPPPGIPFWQVWC